METYHIWLCCIAIDEVLKKKQKENTASKDKITKFTVNGERRKV